MFINEEIILLPICGSLSCDRSLKTCFKLLVGCNLFVLLTSRFVAKSTNVLGLYFKIFYVAFRWSVRVNSYTQSNIRCLKTSYLYAVVKELACQHIRTNMTVQFSTSVLIVIKADLLWTPSFPVSDTLFVMLCPDKDINKTVWLFTWEV